MCNNQLKELEQLKQENSILRKKLLRYEEGSAKSILNCHAEGKKQFKRYVNTFYPHMPSPGDFIRRCIESQEPYCYEDIIGGEF